MTQDEILAFIEEHKDLDVVYECQNEYSTEPIYFVPTSVSVESVALYNGNVYSTERFDALRSAYYADNPSLDDSLHSFSTIDEFVIEESARCTKT